MIHFTFGCNLQRTSNFDGTTQSASIITCVGLCIVTSRSIPLLSTTTDIFDSIPADDWDLPT